jgi:uncharacterized membrane protein
MNTPMTSLPSRLQHILFHPFFFAAYPILALLAFNRTELNISAGLRSLILSIVLSGVFVLIFRRIYHDSQQGALVVTGILVLFFSYGHIYNLLREIHIAGVYLLGFT